AEAVQLLSSRLDDLAGVLGIRDVRDRLAAGLLEDLFQIRIDRVRVVPGDVQDLLGKRAALLLVELADGEEDAGEHLLIRLRLTGRIDRLPLPLQPARRVGERA